MRGPIGFGEPRFIATDGAGSYSRLLLAHSTGAALGSRQFARCSGPAGHKLSWHRPPPFYSVPIMQDPVEAKAADLGIPDWRDPTAYPDPKKLWLSDWRWEFLRRNPQYREAYDRPELSVEDESKGRYFERVYQLCAPVDPRLSAKQFAKLTEGEIFHSDHFDNFVGTQSLSSKYANHKSEIERILVHSSYADIFFRCDPLKPLEPQFKAFYEIARRCQRSFKKAILKPRIRKDKWPLYLRVLDARDCEAKYREIAQVCGISHPDLDGKIGAARDLAKAARQLRDAWPFATEDEL
jgi:hypothetical protein